MKIGGGGGGGDGSSVVWKSCSTGETMEVQPYLPAHSDSRGGPACSPRGHLRRVLPETTPDEPYNSRNMPCRCPWEPQLGMGHRAGCWVSPGYLGNRVLEQILPQASTLYRCRVTSAYRLCCPSFSPVTCGPRLEWRMGNVRWLSFHLTCALGRQGQTHSCVENDDGGELMASCQAFSAKLGESWSTDGGDESTSCLRSMPRERSGRHLQTVCK